MEIIIRGTPEECKKAIKELAEKEKEKEFVPIYPTYPYYDYRWWRPYWEYYGTTTASDTTGSITGINDTYSATSISADDIKVSNNISAIINEATLDCFAKNVPTK